MSSFNEDDVNNYINSILKQIQAYGNIIKNKNVDTLYFGGGTPTLLSEKQLLNIYEQLSKHFKGLITCTEQNIEGCPSSILPSKLKLLKQLGINRISIGVQSFFDDELKALGRVHTTLDSQQAIEYIQKESFKNFNIDLIYGLEGQSYSKWEANLRKLISISPSTASLYPINIRPNTKLFKGKEGSIDDNRAFKMYKMTVELMESENYRQESFVMFTKNDNLSGCLHQENEFLGKPFLGLGVTARSYTPSVHYSTICDNTSKKMILHEFNQKVSQNPCVADIAYFINVEAKARYIILRLMNFNYGINNFEFNKVFHTNIYQEFQEKIDFLKKYELVNESMDKITLSKKGKELSNILPILFSSLNVLQLAYNNQ